MILLTQPSKEHLDEVLDWLNLENATFKSNSNIISRSFDNQTLLVGQQDGKIIAYLAYQNFSCMVNFDIFEVHPDCTKNGFGKTFFKLIEDHFTANNYKVISLFCAPRDSENFWNKMNFIKFPGISDDSPPEYYKPLIDVLASSVTAGNNKLELWDSFASFRGNSEPNLIWDITNNQKPILIPIGNDYHLKLTIKGEEKSCERMKWFFNKNIVECGRFIIIEDLCKSLL